MAARIGRRAGMAGLLIVWLIMAAGCGTGTANNTAAAEAVGSDKGGAGPVEGQTLPLAASTGEAGADSAEDSIVESRYKGVYAALKATDAAKAPEPPGKIAYLTFDDGPSVQTEPILATLHRFGIKATFFVTGHDTEQSKTLYRRIAEEGHRFGNHTFSHDYTKLYRNADIFMEDVRRLDRFLLETVGQTTDILRFPGGSNTRLGRKKGQLWIMPQLVKRVQAEGYQYFDWNVSSTDAAQAVQPKKDIVASVLSAARERRKIIVLMHDVNVKTTTVEALPEVIRGLQQMGFSFETLRKDSFTSQFLK